MTDNARRAEEQDAPGLRRVPTGVPGLDVVLHGGMFAGGIYIIHGAPGTGKTTLANQICFQHARSGGRSLFVTLLSESHARMQQHMRTFSFFDGALVPDGVYYISAFDVLEHEGLKGVMALLRREIRARRVTLLVLDGLLIAAETAASDREFRKFIYEMQSHLAAEGCVALFLTGGDRRAYHPEHTIVDGLISLTDVRYGNKVQRDLEVCKSRASSSLRGRHPYRITADGIVLYPRTEALLAYPSRDNGGSRVRVTIGVPDLDAMMGGGPLCGTTTLILGASGAGKTTLGMHFLASSSAEEPGLHVGFYETPERLLANATAVGLDLAGLVRQGHLEIQWWPATEQILDDLTSKLMEAIRRRNVRRLFVDGLGGYVEAAEQKNRVSQVFTALANELRALGVTTVYAGETNNLVGPEVTVPVEGISAIVENLILLRFAEYRARIHRLLSIMKVRGSGFDPQLREFQISDAGIHLTDSFESAEFILSGFATERPDEPASGRGRTADQPPGDSARMPPRRGR